MGTLGVFAWAAQQKPVEVRTMRVVGPVSFSASAILGGWTLPQKLTPEDWYRLFRHDLPCNEGVGYGPVS
jgi:hypothetical protein